MSAANTVLSKGAKSLISAIGASKKPVAFLVGSAVSATDSNGVRGVPGVQEMIRLAIEQAGTRGHELQAKLQHYDGTQCYQVAMKFLQQDFNQDYVNAVVQRAVLQARSEPVSGTVDAERLKRLDQELAGWNLPAAARDLGHLVAEFPQKFGPILTTNFDPLLSVAVRRARREVIRVNLQTDGFLKHVSSSRENQWIIHLHGYWVESDTLHTREQLTGERPHLLAALRHILHEHDLVVIGYGGWDDVFTRALAQAGDDPSAPVDIMWAFYDSNEDHIEADNKKLLASVGAIKGRARFRKYPGVNCHTFFGALLDDMRRSAQHSPGPRADAKSSGLPPPRPDSAQPSSAPPPEESMARPAPAPAVPTVPMAPSPAATSEAPRVAAPTERAAPPPPLSPASSPGKGSRLPAIALGVLLLAGGYAVLGSRSATKAAPPPAVAVPIGRTVTPVAPGNGTGRTTTRARVPKSPSGTTAPAGNTRTSNQDSPLQPTPSGSNSSTTDGLRAQNQVRALTRGATGYRVAQMPVGSYGFIPLDSVTLLQSASVEETPVPGAFEVHKSNTGNISLLGYAHPATAKAISAGARLNAVLSPDEAGVRTQLVSVPFHRISNAELRMDSDKKVLLLQLGDTLP